MNEIWLNLLILLLNIIVFLWSIHSWKKTVREKWMNNLRDAGAELIGAAELVHTELGHEGLKPQSMSNYLARQHKLILLFAHSEEERENYPELAEGLREAADSKEHKDYQEKLEEFSKIINDRVLEEWLWLTDQYKFIHKLNSWMNCKQS